MGEKIARSCPNCGTENEDDASYCTNCGQQINDIENNITGNKQAAASESTVSTSPSKQRSKPHRSVRKFIYAIATVILAIGFVFGLSAWLSTGGDQGSKYVCPSGETVSDQSQCVICGDGVCEAKQGTSEPGSCPEDCSAGTGGRGEIPNCGTGTRLENFECQPKSQPRP